LADGETAVGGFHIRDMSLEDIDQVAEIEKQSFALPWPPETYRRDLRSNDVAHYLVCEDTEHGGHVVGYLGYWLIQDEVHISTLAVSPGYRGRGLGEYLLASALSQGLAKGARSAILEVRASNVVAQGLYLKYGFRVTGRRRRYYRDNNEDALLMELRSMANHEFRAALHDHWESLMRRLQAEPGSADSGRGEEALPG